MKIAIETLIHEMEGKLSGYATLLIYRYANLCIKAQPMALLSAEIVDEEMGVMNIEKVAGVTMPDEYHLKLIPFDSRFNYPLCKAIKKEHPEFKQDLITPEDASDENERYLILTMPEVNKDRYDALTDSVDMLYNGCKAKMDKTIVDYREKLEKKIATLPTDDERDEAKGALDSAVKTYQGMIDTVKADKVKEIEEAYQRYLKEQTAQEAQEQEDKAARGEDSGRSYKFNAEDE